MIIGLYLVNNNLGLECSGRTKLLMYWCVLTIIMVGLWYYNQSGATELLLMRDFRYGRMCFKSV